MKIDHPIVRSWCRVLENERVAEGTCWLELEAPEIAERAKPGQFAMVGFGTTGWGSPFLPRPNSLAAADGGVVGLLVRMFGAGSRRLASLRPGDSVLLLGPLGNHFETGDARKVLCVAGGVGLAPFLFLARRMGQSVAGPDLHLLYGEKEGHAVFDPGRIEALSGLQAEIWTEEGDRGREGRVTDGLELDGVDLVLACGPTPMLKAVRSQALESGVRCQVAVEAHMACGVGTCIGCAIETIDPDTGEEEYTLVCLEGPVFRAERLRW